MPAESKQPDTTSPTAVTADATAATPVIEATTGVTERAAIERSGWSMIAIAPLLVLVSGLVGFFGLGAAANDSLGGPASAFLMALGVLGGVAGLILLVGLKVVNPGEARVIQLFGKYRGTIRTSGLRWVNPVTSNRAISTRIRNHETGVAKVNDLTGSPIEIAAVVVWRVVDTAKAMFEVDNYTKFVAIQTESAVRHIANSYPYDSDQEGVLSLRENADEITQKLSEEIAARVQAAGVEVIESRITRLAYSPEIAQAMLRRQQASAIIAARKQIVEGAVGMVKDAISHLEEGDVVELDPERKATMVSNLLVVLCGDRDAQPVVNAGSVY